MAQKEWAEKDYYADLGVSSSATQDEIKKAYRKLARENHPDKHPGDKKAEERFKQVSEAYDTIGNEEKRKEYDEFRTMLRSGSFGGAGGFGGGGFTTSNFDLSDLFGGGGSSFGGDFDLSDLFGGGGSSFSTGGRGRSRRAQQQPARGKDIEAEVTVSFRDAAQGTTIPLKITSTGPCETCHGSGAEPGSPAPHECDECQGTGYINDQRGGFGYATPCPKCHGTGTVIEDPCHTCNGTGQQTRTRPITVRIPAGVVDGQRVRLAGQGEAGLRGRPAGDLYVIVHMMPDKLFTRDGDNLRVTVPVTFAEITLGESITVPTLDSSVTVRIPAGSKNGTNLRVKDKGIQKRNSTAGDLLVKLEVAVPKKLSDDAKEKLREYEKAEKASGFDPRQGLNA